MGQPFLPLFDWTYEKQRDPKGVVYTKPWVVELLLDLAGYRVEANLVDALAIEPAAGEGAFLIPLCQRLVASCLARNRPLRDCEQSLIAYEIDEESATIARAAVTFALTAAGVENDEARRLAGGWIKTADFLIDSFGLPEADYVIGNPPYVRLEQIPDQVVGHYRDVYPTMKGRADLYIAFFEASLRLLKRGGVCAYICADRWMLNQYGAELRRFVTAGFSVDMAIEMHNADAFHDDVSAYPAITVIRKSVQGRAVVASLGPDIANEGVGRLTAVLEAVGRGEPSSALPGASITSIDGWFSGNDPWPCSSPHRLALLRNIEERFEPLESQDTKTRVGIGVATGCDGVFITKDKGLVEDSRLLPLALASDTISGHLEWSGHYLVDPWDENGLVDLAHYPKFGTYVEKHKAALSRRHTAKKNENGWYKTIDRVTHTLTSTPKLYIPDIKDVFNPVLDIGTTYPHHNLYFITSEKWNLEVLGGILLSAIGQLFIESYGVRMRGGYLRFQAQYLRRIRVPDPSRIPLAIAKQLVESFRNRDRSLATQAAMELYGLDRMELEPNLGH